MIGRLAYRLSIILGLLPMAAGIATFLLWILTGWVIWETAGFYTLLGGPYVGIAGLACLTIWRWQGQGGEWRRLWTAIGVLLSNFLVAAGLLMGAKAFLSRIPYTLDVANACGSPLTSVEILGPGVRTSFEAIPPGQHARADLHFQGDGGLSISAKKGDQSLHIQVNGRVSSSSRGERTLQIRSDGWSLEKKPKIIFPGFYTKERRTFHRFDEHDD